MWHIRFYTGSTYGDTFNMFETKHEPIYKFTQKKKSLYINIISEI